MNSVPLRPLRFVLLLTLTFASLAGAQNPPAKRAMTIDDIYALKQVSDPQISPDGTRVVYVVSSADFERGRWDTDLWLVKTSEGPASARQITFNIGRDNSPRWSPDGRTIAFLRARAGTGQTSAQIYLLPVDPGGEAYAVTSEPRGVNSFEWSPDGGAIFYLAAQGAEPATATAAAFARDRAVVEDADRPVASLWYLNLATREKSRIATGTGHVREFAIAPDGKAVVFAAAPTSYFNDSPQTELFYLSLSAAEPGAPRQLTRNSLIPESGMAWRPDGSGILFRAGADPGLKNPAFQGLLFYWDRKTDAIRHLPVKTATNLQENFVGPVGEALWLDNARILLRAETGIVQHLYVVAFEQGTTLVISSGFEVASSVSLDRQARTAAFLRQTPSGPAEVILKQIMTGLTISVGSRPPDPWREQVLTAHHAHLSNLELPGFEVIRWKASDGQMVEGIFLEPPASANAKRPYPTVTVIHGGPASAEMASFRGFANVLTSAGMAVFLPNYRGSTNYGEEFAARSLGDRNGRDAQDILEGVDELVRRGWADKDRLGVMGWSAGGVLTNWLVANTTRFRAASAGAGVTDWRMQYFLSDSTYGSRQYFRGSPWEKNDLYWERSPLRLAAQVKTPTLIHCGERDERVPIEHARAWFRALREHGVETRFVVYPGEPHGFLQPAHQRRRNTEDLQWFKRYLLGRL